MSDKPIQVGDLVQVVKPCPFCGDCSFIGDIYIVRGFFDECTTGCCKIDVDELSATDYIDAANESYGNFVCTLKRIPPLDELKTTEIELEVTA